MNDIERDPFGLRDDARMLRALGQRSACFRVEREASGYSSAEALGQFAVNRLISLTIASVALDTTAEQIFAIVGVLATDLLVSVTPGTVAVAAGEFVVPSRISSAANMAVLVGNVTSLAIAAQAALAYNVLVYRR